MSSEEDSFGWTTASSDNDIMHTEDVHHTKTQKKMSKKKVKEESLNDSALDVLENIDIKRKDHGSLSQHTIVTKKEVDSNMGTPITITKKDRKHKSLSNSVVLNDEVISGIPEFISKRKHKKHKMSNMSDYTQLNEISKIDNQDTTSNLDLNEIFDNVSTNIKEEPVAMRETKKNKKRIKSENFGMVNGHLKMELENSIHEEYSQEVNMNSESAAEESKRNRLEKRTKKKRKYENIETTSLNAEQTSLENVEVSPIKKKKRKLDIGLASSIDYADKRNESGVKKTEVVTASGENYNVSQISENSTETDKITHRRRESNNSLSSVQNSHNAETVTSRVYEKRSLSTSSSDSLINSNISNADVKFEEPINIQNNGNESPNRKENKKIKKRHKLRQSTTIASDEAAFENQTVDYDNTPGCKLQNSKVLSQFIIRNKHLTPMKSKYATDSFLTEDDDIWIVKCPKEINIKALHESDLIIDNKCKLKIDKQNYQGVLNDRKINVALPFIDGEKFVVKNCIPKGIIRLRKRIPTPHFAQDFNLDNVSCSIPLPDTKLRHPLFGFDYKSYVKLPSYVADKLQRFESDLSENYSSFNRKKKKKKIKVEIEGGSHRKNKKRKISVDSDTNVVKTKRKKHNISAEGMWESEKSIEENLFNL